MNVRKKKISIVIPCFNEDESIQVTIDRLTLLKEEINGYDLELLFIDDGSTDNTVNIIDSNINKNGIKLVCFSRNFGHQIAVSAGIDLADGDAVVLIDADLQDPPEVIIEMIKIWNSGYDVVYGQRKERAGESYFKLLTAKYFYKSLNYLSNTAIPHDTGDFRLMDKKVIEVLRSMPEKDRFLRGMISWVGFNQIAIEYNRQPRFAGESKYPLRKMIKFALDGILSFSTKPLKISVGIGLICASISLLGILYAILMRVLTNNWVEGWTALMIAVLFIGGVQLVSVGILGEYIGRIYNEIKARPLYIIKNKNGFENENK